MLPPELFVIVFTATLPRSSFTVAPAVIPATSNFRFVVTLVMWSPLVPESVDESSEIAPGTSTRNVTWTAGPIGLVLPATSVWNAV